jgi:hypothetical protein
VPVYRYPFIRLKKFGTGWMPRQAGRLT